jgi:probable HAF family extracellular repeat protein
MSAKHALGVRVGVSFIRKSEFRGLENIERKHVMKMCLPALFATALMTGTSVSPAQSYNITDLGPVSGDAVSVGYGLNNLGQAVGTSSNPSAAIPTLFSNGETINLGLFEPGDASVATAINGSAEVVGYEFFGSLPGNTSHAWLYSNGTLTDIHSPTLFPQGTTPHGINSSGVVVGEGDLGNSSFHAFVYASGQMVDIGPPGSFQASAVAINDAGQIVGSFYTAPGNAGPFLYANGQFTYLGQPAGTSVDAAGLNSLGQVAGTIYVNNGSLPPHAAVFSNGVWTDLGAFDGVATHGTGINTAGQVIGTAFFPVKSYHPFIPGKRVALIAKNGNLSDLNKSIPANAGLTLTASIAINDNGQILCNATTTTTPSFQRAVLLSPK